ncbi:hypothetical protein GGF32_006915 [Allomyces javanicus]|nr:hypothetical protein GGF32_006915 [Allomyces javanicus]
MVASAPTVPRVSQPLRSDHDDSASLMWRANLRPSSSKPDLSPLAEPRSRSHSPAAQTNTLQDPRRLLPAPHKPQPDATLVPTPVPATAPVAEEDRFRVPTTAQLIASVQFVHIDKARDQIMFYVLDGKKFAFLTIHAFFSSRRKEVEKMRQGNKQSKFMILFGLRASSAHDTGTPYPISVCEPIVITSDSQHGRSLVDTLVEAHGTLPAPARVLIKNILSVSAQLAEIVRMSGGMAVAVSSEAQWHLNLPSVGQRDSHAQPAPVASVPPSLVPAMPPQRPIPQPAPAAPAAPPTVPPMPPRQPVALPQSASAAPPPALLPLPTGLLGGPVMTATAPAVVPPMMRTVPPPVARSAVAVVPIPAGAPIAQPDAHLHHDGPAPLVWRSNSSTPSHPPDDRVAMFLSQINQPDTFTPPAPQHHGDGRSSQLNGRSAASRPKSRHEPSTHRHHPERPPPASVPPPPPPPPPPRVPDLSGPPTSAQRKNMVPFLVKIRGGRAADLVPHMDKIAKLVSGAQFVHVDPTRNEIMFYVPRNPLAVANVLRETGVVIVGMWLEFEPVNPNDVLSMGRLRTAPRNAFLVVYPPDSNRFMIAQLARVGFDGAFIDRPTCPLPGTNIPFVYLTLPGVHSGKQQLLDQVDFENRKTRIVPIKSAAAVFANHERHNNLLRSAARETVK